MNSSKAIQIYESTDGRAIATVAENSDLINTEILRIVSMKLLFFKNSKIHFKIDDNCSW